jgi:SH3-like domain-containing protein
VDPYYHLYDDHREPPALGDRSAELPRWVRVAARGAEVRPRPEARAGPVTPAPADTPLELLAGTGPWLLARLPNGREGYLDERFTEPLAPIGVAPLAVAVLLRSAPDDTAGPTDEVPAGRAVSVLGRFGDYLLVRDSAGAQGWVVAGTLAAFPVGAGRLASAGGAGARSTAASAAPRP